MFTVVCTSIALSASSVLSAVGFKASGVAAGSIAAGVQASIGSVKAGSAFAAAQSLQLPSLFRINMFCLFLILLR